MDENQLNTFDDSDPNQMYDESQDNFENDEHLPPSQDREPDYPTEIQHSENQFSEADSKYEKQMQGRPLKKKKSKKGKNKNNISMTNRSASAKWRKIDPYIQGAPQNMRLVKQLKKANKIESEDTGYSLPPIKKQSTNQMNKNPNPRSYKPLKQPKMQKANSVALQDLGSHKQLNLDEEETKQKVHKLNEVDYEKKNLERLQKIQEKKAQELAMMEEQRQKAQEEREKLKKIVSNQNMFIFSSEISIFLIV